MTTASAAGDGYDYFTSNGEDWPDLEIDGNMCGGPNQSPINLSRYGSYPLYSSSDDMISKSYTNQYDVEVAVLPDTTKVTLNSDITNKYHSMLATEVFGAPMNWNAA